VNTIGLDEARTAKERAKSLFAGKAAVVGIGLPRPCLRFRLDRLARDSGAEDAAGRLVGFIAWGESHGTVRASRRAVWLVVHRTQADERGGADEALVALDDGQRRLARPQDKVMIRAHPPGPAPHVEDCGLTPRPVPSANPFRERSA
jgi:hypothetical protein